MQTLQDFDETPVVVLVTSTHSHLDSKNPFATDGQVATGYLKTWSGSKQHEQLRTDLPPTTSEKHPHWDGLIVVTFVVDSVVVLLTLV